MRNVNVIGVGMTPFGRHLERPLRELTAEAVGATLRDAGADAGEVGMVFFANSMAGLLSGQESIRGQVNLAGCGLEGVPLVNVENACASGSTAVHLAWLAVASGQCEAALAVGAEKLYHADKRRSFEALASALDVERVEDLRARLGAQGPEAQQRSVFMDYYAQEAQRFFQRSGATQRDYAQVAVKSHHHAALNPRAQYREPLTIEEVLASRTIVEPLTLLMCSPIGDGAAAVLVGSDAYAAQVDAPPVRLRASVLRSGRPETPEGTVPATVQAAYDHAGVGPEDLDVIECHDATAPAELILYETLGLCGPGEAAKLLWNGDTSLGGRTPVNPSGGLISKGHPVGASGCAQLVELTEQLRGQAGARQVEGARVALAENAGGLVDRDVAACAVTILST